MGDLFITDAGKNSKSIQFYTCRDNLQPTLSSLENFLV